MGVLAWEMGRSKGRVFSFKRRSPITGVCRSLPKRIVPAAKRNLAGVMVLGTKGKKSGLMALANAILWLLLVAKRFY